MPNNTPDENIENIVIEDLPDNKTNEKVENVSEMSQNKPKGTSENTINSWRDTYP